jgi:hypothetical protein
MSHILSSFAMIFVTIILNHIAYSLPAFWFIVSLPRYTRKQNESDLLGGCTATRKPGIGFFNELPLKKPALVPLAYCETSIPWSWPPRRGHDPSLPRRIHRWRDCRTIEGRSHPHHATIVRHFKVLSTLPSPPLQSTPYVTSWCIIGNPRPPKGRWWLGLARKGKICRAVAKKCHYQPTTTGQGKIPYRWSIS